jgi:hypothetical protein
MDCHHCSDDICFTPLVYTMSIGENFIKPVMEISTFQKKNYSQKPFYMFPDKTFEEIETDAKQVFSMQ